MAKNKAEVLKRSVDGLKASVAKAKELAKGNKYEPVFREARLRLKHAQRKLDWVTGKKTARRARKKS